jgi:tape measure domain-containing protein
MEADRVVVELVAKSRNFDATVVQSRRTFETQMTAIRGSAVGAEQSVTRSLGVMGAGLKSFVGGISAVLIARGFLAATDAAKQLEAQLRLATMASGNFAQAQDDVRRIAQTTRSGLQETAQLYATFQRNAVELGISQQQAARATETVSKAFQISGASAAEAAGGLRQFLQGVQSGTLRGEELNSVLENAPRLAKLVAESLGVTIGELRKMGQEGELTAEKLIRALTDRKFTAAIDAEFKELPVTFEQAMVQVKNAAIITFGAFDRGGEFSSALVNFITDGTGGFADLARSAENLGIEIRAVMAGLADVFEPMLAGARSVFGSIEGEAQGLRRAIADVLGAVDALRNIGPNIANKVNEFTGNQQRFPLADARGTFLRGAQQSELDRRRRLILSPDAAARTLAEFGATPPPSGGRRPSSTSTSKGKKGPSAETLAKRAKAEADRQEREEQSYRAEISGLNQDIIAAKKALVTSAEIIAELETEALDERAKAYAEEQASQVKLGKITQTQADELLKLNGQIIGLKKDAVQAALRESQFRAREETLRQQSDLSQAQLSAQADLLRSEADLATTAKERHDIERRIIDLQFQEERLRNEYVIAWAARVQANQDASEAEKRAAQAAADLAQLQIDTSGQRQANAQTGNDQANASPLQAYFQDIPNTAAEINEAFEELAAGGLASVTDGLTEAILGMRSFGDVGRQVLAQLVAGLIKMAIQQVILATVGQSIAATTTAANAALGAATAAAWAPAAAAVSLATFGANAAPASAALVSTHALSSALSAPKGFKLGGYTGDGSPDDAAGIVHRREFVFDAAATQRIGARNLEAMRNGSIRPSNAVAASPGGSGGANLSPDAVSKLSGIVREAIEAMPPIQLFPTFDPVAAMRAAMNSREGRRVMAEFMDDNSGLMDGALGQ